MEGIILSGWLAGMRVMSSFNVSLEQTSNTSLSKDELLNLCNNKKLLPDLESVKLGRFQCKFGGAYHVLTK
jgi:hypothetical protein